MTTEYTALPEAVLVAESRAALTGIVHHVIGNETVFWVAGARAKSELWPDREPVHTATPAVIVGNAKKLRAEATLLCASRTTAELVELFGLTDKLLDDRGKLNPGEDLSICTTRGFIIDALVSRGEQARIGLE